MTGPSALPVLTSPPVVQSEWHRSFRAMASPVSVTLGPGCVDPEHAFARIVEVFEDVAAQCTRFDPDSDLMRANRAGRESAQVGPYCEAARAHLQTRGRFDPRVLGTLIDLGYARSLESGRDGGEVPIRPVPRYPWVPRFDPDTHWVRIGSVPVDLGGIGKGLAVRWAAQEIEPMCPSFLLDAGGDLLVRGPSPDAEFWRIAVEDPRGGDGPIAVLGLTDAACVTSSVRRLRWDRHGRQLHHLIDPATGAPGGAGLLAVTVADSDPAEAEVWAKAYFLAGADGIAELAEHRAAAVLWVREDGRVGFSTAMRPLVIWPELP